LIERLIHRSSSQTFLFKEQLMPQGDKSKYTDKQKRQARHIEEGYEHRGVSEKKAAARAWATVNAQDGGGKQSGSGRRSKSTSKKPAKKRTSMKSLMKKKRSLAHA
jgi:plasmid stabilization system protein ParE